MESQRFTIFHEQLPSHVLDLNFLGVTNYVLSLMGGQAKPFRFEGPPKPQPNPVQKPILALLSILLASSAPLGASDGSPSHSAERHERVRYGHESIDDVEIFYREAGQPGKPEIVLLHGFPTSSHMFRELIPRLAKDFHVIAPDYPGFGLSSAPDRSEFDYSFEHFASIVDQLLERRGFKHYALYLMDYGAPVGYRLACQHPERISALVVQNGNAYEAGLREFWDPIKRYWKSGASAEREALRGLLTLGATQWQFQHGTRQPETISPDNWLVTQPLLEREGNQEIQLDLFYDYRTNLPLYPSWQKYFRDHQPPTLILWGEHDPIFPAEGAHPYLRDLPKAELHLLNTGHFALEEDGALMAAKMRAFLLNLPTK